MKKFDRIKAVIHLDAVLNNFEEMRRHIQKDTKIMAVIKADAYGHGAVPIARLVEDKPYIWGFGAATAEEALSLRRAGIKKPILVLGLVFEEHFRELAKQDVRIAICDYQMAAAFAQEGRRAGRTVHIHLAVDTGMTRIGYGDEPGSIEEIKRISQLEGLVIEGLFTHFARADEYDREPAMIQLDRYLRFADLLKKNGILIPLRHCSNSAGIIRIPEANLNLVRAGITIYGIYPSQEVEQNVLKLLPAMELKSHVSYVKEVPGGTQVSYGGTYVTEGRTRLATIPVGYADGYPRSLSGKGWVLIHGKKAPIRGRICMDQMMVDVTEIPEVRQWDEVTIMGWDQGAYLGVDTLGELSGRFPYEFVCGVSKRVPRVYVKEGREVETVAFFD